MRDSSSMSMRGTGPCAHGVGTDAGGPRRYSSWELPEPEHWWRMV
jgi:hypothetical protein